jgi:hypothetical protein
LMAIIKTLIGGHDADKKTRSNYSSKRVIWMHQHQYHNQEEQRISQEGHKNIYNRTLSKIELTTFHGEKPRG